jgi:hypothetical protein
MSEITDVTISMSHFVNEEKEFLIDELEENPDMTDEELIESYESHVDSFLYEISKEMNETIFQNIDFDELRRRARDEH